MKKLIKQEVTRDLSNQRLIDIPETCHYLGGVGRNTAYEFLKSIGALRKIGKRTFGDREVIDTYFDNQKEG